MKIPYNERLEHNGREHMIKIMDSLEKLYLAKNEDYGDAANVTYQKYGPISYIVRLEDKFNRLRQLGKVGYSNKIGESIEDTLEDSINYLIMYTASLTGESYSDARGLLDAMVDLRCFNRNDKPVNPFDKVFVNYSLDVMNNVRTLTNNLYAWDTVQDSIRVTDFEPNEKESLLIVVGMLTRACLRELAHMRATEDIYAEDKGIDSRQEVADK